MLRIHPSVLSLSHRSVDVGKRVHELTCCEACFWGRATVFGECEPFFEEDLIRILYELHQPT